MKKNNGIVYLLRDNSNGKCYIGQTFESLEQHWKGHCKCAEKGSHRLIHIAIRKAGVDSFQQKVLQDQIPTRQTLQQQEKYWIAVMKTEFPNGYNMNKGGNGSADPKLKSQLALNQWNNASSKIRRKIIYSMKKYWSDKNHQNERAVRTRNQMNNQWADPVNRKVMIQATIDRWKDPTIRAKIETSLKKVRQKPEYHQKLRNSWTPEKRKLFSDRQKARWADPEYRKKTGAKLSISVKESWKLRKTKP